jgi:peptide deformylase
LSIPLTFGDVERPKSVTLEGESVIGKKIKINARDLLARVFQHELDHLNGVLFTDKAKNIRRESPGGENEIL